MSGSSGGVVREAFTWVVVIGGLTLMLLNFDAIRAVNSALLGIDQPQSEDASADAADTNKGGLRPLFKSAAPEAPRQQVSTSGFTVELASDNRGHYEAAAEINGRDINALVDTGASMVVLTYEDAERAGIYVKPSDFTMQSRTANGIARNAPVTLDEVCIESVCVRDVRAMVAEEGRLHVSLLGMTYLGRLARFEVRSGRLLLEE